MIYQTLRNPPAAEAKIVREYWPGRRSPLGNGNALQVELLVDRRGWAARRSVWLSRSHRRGPWCWTGCPSIPPLSTCTRIRPMLGSSLPLGNHVASGSLHSSCTFCLSRTIWAVPGNRNVVLAIRVGVAEG